VTRLQVPQGTGSIILSIRFVTVLSILLLAGCASVSPSIPDNYSGPCATLKDSALIRGRTKADMFVAETLNGEAIENSILQSKRASAGRGFSLKTGIIERQIVAGKPLRVGLKARTVHAAPILALAGTVYQVTGEVEFTPQPDAKYVVRGKFSEDYSAIWIEDAASKEVVGKKIEVNGSAKLGLLDK